jgi:hypothetical protein
MSGHKAHNMLPTGQSKGKPGSLLGDDVFYLFAATLLGLCNYGCLINTLFTDVEGVT